MISVGYKMTVVNDESGHTYKKKTHISNGEYTYCGGVMWENNNVEFEFIDTTRVCNICLNGHNKSLSLVGAE